MKNLNQGNLKINNLKEIVTDEVFFSIDNLSRELPNRPTVRSFGIKPSYTSIVEVNDNFYSFSFIVKGTGTVIENDISFKVMTPCLVFLQPENKYRMIPEDKWDEFYITFSETNGGFFSLLGLKNLENPIIPLHTTDFLLDSVNKLFKVVRQISSFGMADRFDNLFKELLIDVLANKNIKSEVNENNDKKMRTIYQIKHYIDKNFSNINDVKQLSNKISYSTRHFRRVWKEEFGSSPQKYLIRRKMEQACFLLKNSDMLISEIARNLGYSNQYYFSKYFKQFTGKSPSDYRENKKV